MKFKAILDVPHDKDSGILNRQALRAKFANVPEPVFEQVLLDHGRNEAFQTQYGELDLCRINWILETVSGTEIIACTRFKQFDARVQNVRCRAHEFRVNSWRCFGHSDAVRNYWQKHRTWFVPPVMIEGALVGTNSKLHLIEGHTRLGILMGLIDIEEISAGQVHQVWVGHFEPCAATGSNFLPAA